MGYQVTPTYNSETGEYGEPVIEHRGTHPESINFNKELQGDGVLTDEQFVREAHTADPAFLPNASRQDVHSFWTSNRAITNDEISIIQDQIMIHGPESDEGRRLGRLLTYRASGDTSSLLPDDYEYLNISEPDAEAITTEDIDRFLIAELPEKAEEWELGNWIAETRPLGSSPAATVVQHFATQYLLGRISNKEMFFNALNSGVPQPEIYSSFESLTEFF